MTYSVLSITIGFRLALKPRNVQQTWGLEPVDGDV